MPTSAQKASRTMSWMTSWMMLCTMKRRLLGIACLTVVTIVLDVGNTSQAAQNQTGVRVDEADGTLHYTNRLINEKSPYLQMHAHDPVDWHPWGAEAFETARREGKPIFLSVGYSTCHWCHVMEAESFSNPAIAELMNRSFVSIKVDREERPDIDRIYMTYVQTMDVGGWPMSVFLTPALKPFFGASYLPPDDRDGNVGFRTLLQRMSALWTTDRGKALQAADTGIQLMIDAQAANGRRNSSTATVSARVLDDTYVSLTRGYDAVAGGFGGSPKFPRPVQLNFLLRYYARTGKRPALDMTLQTLRAMARGGVHDQLGGGFHRYSTDRAWRVPHFEKMLYDQAQLAVSYTEAYQITRDVEFAATARDILDYVLRDMRGADDGFLSAEDADSLTETGKRAEGAYYVWTDAELRAILGPEVADVFAFRYGVERAGNVPANQDAEGELAGKNVLAVRHTTAEAAARFGKPESDIRAVLDAARRTLGAARAARPRPSRDDKVLVAWNGMMISAFAYGAQVFDDPRYLDAARQAAAFIEQHLYDESANVLKRRYWRGDVDIDAVLEDYTFFIQGLLDLYEASFDVRWLSWAARLQARQDELFWDAADGGYFSTRAEAEHILVRVKDDYDGAEPSPNSIAAMNLLRLWQVTDRDDWRAKATALFHALANRLTRSGSAVPQLAVALGFSLSKPTQIVIAGDPDGADTRAMLRLVHDRFIPNKIVLLADGGDRQETLAKWLPFVGSMDRRNGRATIYICENYACRLPTSDVKTAAALLDATPGTLGNGKRPARSK